MPNQPVPAVQSVTTPVSNATSIPSAGPGQGGASTTQTALSQLPAAQAEAGMAPAAAPMAPAVGAQPVTPAQFGAGAAIAAAQAPAPGFLPNSSGSVLYPKGQGPVTEKVAPEPPRVPQQPAQPSQPKLARHIYKESLRRLASQANLSPIQPLKPFAVKPPQDVRAMPQQVPPQTPAQTPSPQVPAQAPALQGQPTPFNPAPRAQQLKAASAQGSSPLAVGFVSRCLERGMSLEQTRSAAHRAASLGGEFQNVLKLAASLTQADLEPVAVVGDLQKTAFLGFGGKGGVTNYVSKRPSRDWFKMPSFKDVSNSFSRFYNPWGKEMARGGRDRWMANTGRAAGAVGTTAAALAGGLMLGGGAAGAAAAAAGTAGRAAVGAAGRSAAGTAGRGLLGRTLSGSGATRPLQLGTRLWGNPGRLFRGLRQLRPGMNPALLSGRLSGGGMGLAEDLYEGMTGQGAITGSGWESLLPDKTLAGFVGGSYAPKAVSAIGRSYLPMSGADFAVQGVTGVDPYLRLAGVGGPMMAGGLLGRMGLSRLGSGLVRGGVGGGLNRLGRGLANKAAGPWMGRLGWGGGIVGSLGTGAQAAASNHISEQVPGVMKSMLHPDFDNLPFWEKKKLVDNSPMIQGAQNLQGMLKNIPPDALIALLGGLGAGGVGMLNQNMSGLLPIALLMLLYGGYRGMQGNQQGSGG